MEKNTSEREAECKVLEIQGKKWSTRLKTSEATWYELVIVDEDWGKGLQILSLLFF